MLFIDKLRNPSKFLTNSCIGFIRAMILELLGKITLKLLHREFAKTAEDHKKLMGLGTKESCHSNYV